MSSVGKAVNGFFDGLFGDAEPYNKDIDPQQAEYMRQQQELKAQQEAQLKAEQEKLDHQRTAALRGRFSAGGSGGSSDQPVPNTANTDTQAASLFSRITGRTDA